jgi:hypothetical protein
MHKGTLTLPAFGWAPPSPASGRGAHAYSSSPVKREREGPTAKRWEGEGALDFEDFRWI